MSLIVGIALFGPIDRTSLDYQKFFNQMTEQIENKELNTIKNNSISASWDKVNLTPRHPLPMAGYRPRDHFENVHDSLYARLLYLEIGNQSIAIINIDLLLFPPLLKAAIESKIKEIQPDMFLYFSATHTHNGIGGWENSLLGKFVSGTYHEEWIESTANGIIEVLANQKVESASLSYWENSAHELVVNRIAKSKGEEDATLRGLQIIRADSTRALLFSFSAHPTSITRKSLTLSADYPGKTIALIENDFDFGMFLGGMVGSHSFEHLEKENFELVDLEGNLVYQKIKDRQTLSNQDSASVSRRYSTFCDSAMRRRSMAPAGQYSFRS
jgi:hypothetical protein